MNIKSAELLNQSLQNAADNIYRNRALAATTQEEAQRNAVEQSFRNAMMQHYANIEQKQAQAADIQEQRLKNEDDAVEKRYGVQQAMQAVADAQAQMTQGLQELSLDTKLSPSQKTQYFRESIDSQPQYKTQFLQNPMWNALYQGQGDWDAVASAVTQYRATKNGKLGTINPGDNADFGREASRAPQRLANAIAQADPSVPKDPDTGKPTLPVTANPADAQRMGVLAGQLAAAGIASPIPTAAGLIFGTNATVRPNISPASPGTGSAGSVPGNNGSATGTTTNSFTLMPGGISQDALANVQSSPGGPAILKSFGLSQPQGAPASGRVTVRRPDGAVTTIPAQHLNAALQFGYKPITQ